MNCQEASGKFDPFLENRLNVRETAAFIKHIENCPECRDELEVRYMVRYTADNFRSPKMSEDEESYDLRHLLEDKIKERKRFVGKQHLVSLSILLLIILAVAALIVWFFFIPSGGLF